MSFWVIGRSSLIVMCLIVWWMRWIFLLWSWMRFLGNFRCIFVFKGRFRKWSGLLRCLVSVIVFVILGWCGSFGI